MVPTAPKSLKYIPDAINASRGDHGLALYPKIVFKRSAKIFQVEGINCAGPIAPPYPATPAIGQETAVLKALNPRSLVMLKNTGTSRVGCITFAKAVLVFFPTPAPVSGLVR